VCVCVCVGGYVVCECLYVGVCFCVSACVLDFISV